ncbi:RNA polymerase, sigma-24 subunit, ECF subfamily [Cellulomonas flavigena DSM 20109]|uniref:RNA polymerase, sigma-24 subunit, ECF subfamily n=1 Tax=Cellulomonas flavigena (strain ATCC 482 / DSM 20109 / BCRC 11376 / JCM 18109 / NBRC 3775 / NCIMB 8073 / NRS 134) TaxID=446466 RepID=D5UG47_CELFN|nr:SigE family RNA polymerase sigma factor [Cellulomonas flavigena]ADG75070.1 RNA polymerase, sigma-24 subunit, ECF subfamily [Cellulomonas flavigena DSM 20109]
MQLRPPPDPALPAETVPVTARASSRAGRDEEFTAFMTQAAPALLRTAWLLVGDAHRAEDLTQQALVRTYTAWPRVRDGNPTAYARRVLVNLRTDTWRRRRREVLSPPDELPDLAAPQDTTTEDRDQLDRALQRLTPRQRRVVVLRYLVGLSEREVADDLHVSVGTVKSTASRALASLRDSLTDPSTGSTS